MIPTLGTILSMLLPAAAVAGTQTADKGSPRTLENLQAAFDGESNARNKYLAFAKKAVEEGYGEVASLFRAAAKAEEIHAHNHGVVIRSLGAEPKADIQAPEVKSTRENLAVAIAGETYERDTMYPEFIAEAKAAKNSDALRTFTFAIKTEAEHARLYTEALNKLETLKGASRQYFVCAVCGYTTENLNFLRCLVCGVAKEEYIRVS
ncbi:MAG: ferritin family protein [Terriglobales bacterium]|jgi:rubrerythrin